MVSRSAAYPPALCRIWALLIMRGRLRPEDADSILLLREQCYSGDAGDEGELADSEGEEETVNSQTPQMQAEAKDKCHAKLARLHKNLGHCSNRLLHDILKR